MAVEMLPFRAEMPEKRVESPPACETAQRIQSLACSQEHGRSVTTVTLPCAHLVSWNNGGHAGQRAAGRARLAQA